MTYRLVVQLAICASSLHAVGLPAGAGDLHTFSYTSRPPGHPNGSQRAMVWAIDDDVTELLPLPKGLQGSYAFDIS